MPIDVIKSVKVSGGDYTSLTAAEAGEQRNLVAADEVAVIQIDGVWALADTTPVVIGGWTTDATRYIRIYTTAMARHKGKWSTSAYRLSALTADVLGIYQEYVRIEGLQIENTNTSPSITAVRSVNGVWLLSNFIRTAITDNIGQGINIGTYGAGRVNIIVNNIIQMLSINPSSVGLIIESTHTDYIYNNTIISNARGILSGWDVNSTCINNLVRAVLACFIVYAGSNHSHNASIDATAPGTNSRINQTFTFENWAAGDFHLATSDTGAKDFGKDLSLDPNYPFNIDIDGDIRTVTWDIGADEVVQQGGAVLQPPKNRILQSLLTR